MKVQQIDIDKIIEEPKVAPAFSELRQRKELAERLIKFGALKALRVVRQEDSFRVIEGASNLAAYRLAVVLTQDARFTKVPAKVYSRKQLGDILDMLSLQDLEKMGRKHQARHTWKLIARELGETELSPVSQVRHIVCNLGPTRSVEILQQSKQLYPTVFTKDGSRPRTLGGIFLTLGREELLANRKKFAAQVSASIESTQPLEGG